jgi:hypothetical protein
VHTNGDVPSSLTADGYILWPQLSFFLSSHNDGVGGSWTCPLRSICHEKPCNSVIYLNEHNKEDNKKGNNKDNKKDNKEDPGTKAIEYCSSLINAIAELIESLFEGNSDRLVSL